MVSGEAGGVVEGRVVVVVRWRRRWRVVSDGSGGAGGPSHLQPAARGGGAEEQVLGPPRALDQLRLRPARRVDDDVGDTLVHVGRIARVEPPAVDRYLRAGRRRRLLLVGAEAHLRGEHEVLQGSGGGGGEVEVWWW